MDKHEGLRQGLQGANQPSWRQPRIASHICNRAIPAVNDDGAENVRRI